jgi:hypothetical protein
MSQARGILSYLQNLYIPKTKANKLILLAVLVGSSIGITKIYRKPQDKKREELITTTKQTKKPKVAVDKIFFKRLWTIIKIVIPTWRSAEFLNLIILTVLLYARTVLSIK